MERLFYLDNAKGILIILVIVGHAFQFIYPEYDHNFLFRVIYSFHMPLFFCISGYLANRRKKHSFNVIKKRFIQLLIPFVTWAFISPLIYNDRWNVNTSLDILLYPNSGLWFLYNLFIYSAIFNIAEWLEQKFLLRHYITICFAILGLYVLMAIFHNKFNCTQLCFHIPFYTIGYYYKQILDYFKINYWIFGCLYIITVPFWMRVEPPLFYQYINLGRLFSYLYGYFVQIVGMLFFFNLSKIFLDKKILGLQEIGKNTLGIYVIHFPVIKFLINNIYIDAIFFKIIIISIITVPLTYVVVYGIRKIPYIRLLLIGEK